MDYPLENLGPERFQELCQSLLVAEYPRVQCFPIAQPDGGRDAVSYYAPAEGKSIVFQVKFVRKPLAEKDPHKWLVAHIREELPKILKLRKKGATQYVLITNVPGTAHPEVGSIDTANALLSQETGLEGYCWWRDDINRRLDSNWNLKWSYPEIMTGPDFLRTVIEQGVSEDKERRTNAIKAFLRSQYLADEEVRFKQIELHNKLFELFIDVPIKFQDESADQQQFHAFRGAIAGYMAAKGEPAQHDFDLPLANVSDNYFSDGRGGIHRQVIGAASFFLSRSAQELLPLVVIEGAPGQGKSTITQYLCQVHRTKLLNEDHRQLTLDSTFESTSVRLPIRVDLRDYATWLTRRSPFSSEANDAVPIGWHKSLESFLSALISEFSGGIAFSSSDLLALFKPSAVLLVLDGLDEVADIARRKEIVEEIVKGVQRLQETSASLQVIVTSRPAAFANSPGMPHSKYPYLQLISLSKSSILEYAERSMKAKRLEPKNTTEFRKILKEKLDQPHLRDLARNPMQLAILLTLILTRGSSLPDKRTALYDFYIDLFFSREAEKSDVVRNHRQLLIDIHAYLGWLLHAESELGEARARISQERLLTVVSQYLKREGHNVALAELLFTGMVERVVALVSRFQGTFEFEVQPLREYFAAYYLYDTAPQSSAGKEQAGSRPDRFDALARNFYWLNVVRFYAGRYSKGELPSLIERLEELATSEDFSRIGHPRLLAATLLSDWVFTQSPRSVTKAVSLTLQHGKLRYLTVSTSVRYRKRHTSFTFLLPPSCGREELINSSFSLLQTYPKADFEDELIQLVKVNTDKGDDLFSVWVKYFKAATSYDQRIAWFRRALELEIIRDYTNEQIGDLIGDLAVSRGAIALLHRHGYTSFLSRAENTFDLAIDIVLGGGSFFHGTPAKPSVLDQLSMSVQVHLYAIAFRNRDPIPFSHLLAQYQAPLKAAPTKDAVSTRRFKNYDSCKELIKICSEQRNVAASEWATSISPWDVICEGGRSRFGERWSFVLIANVASGIRSKVETCSEYPSLLDHSKSLCRRMRYARLRSGNSQWWTAQLNLANNEFDFSIILLSLLTWAKKSTLSKLVKSLQPGLESLSSATWGKVLMDSRILMFREDSKLEQYSEVAEIPHDLSSRLACVFAARSVGEAARTLHETYFNSEMNADMTALEFVMSGALDLPNIGKSAWNPNLALIRQVYAKGFSREPRDFFGWRKIESVEIPLSVARLIADSPLEYPSFLLAMAEDACGMVVTKNVVPVSTIADRDKWF